MAKETIAWDLDNVHAPSAQYFINDSNTLWGHDLTVDQYHEDWPAVWQCEMEEAKRRAEVIHEPARMRAYEPFPEAPGVLDRLSEWYRHVIITSRPAVVRECTIDWVEFHFPNVFDGVHFAGIWDEVDDRAYEAALAATKTGRCEELEVDYLVDDETKHCLGAHQAGIQAVCVGDYGWNRGVELPEGIVRVPNLLAAEAYFVGRV